MILNTKYYRAIIKEYNKVENNLMCILKLFEKFCIGNFHLKKSIYNKIIEYIERTRK